MLLAVGIWDWLHRLGGAGLIVLGLADNSLIPIPGSVDALTIILAASNKEWWWIYAIAATIGAVVGGFLTFRLSCRGEEAVEKETRVPKDKLKRAQRLFRKWGFGSVMIPAILPPPVPIVPFLVTAGAMRYPTRKFLLALSLGRSVRYFVVAWLGHRYGQQIFGFFSQYYKPILIALIALAVAGGLVGLVLLLKRRKRQRKQPARKAA